MSKLLQLRGGTTTEHASFTGAVREVTVDTDKDTLVIHDGSTAGGFALPRTDAEIRAAVEAATDSNVFTDADHSKLNAIEAFATADQTDAEIRAAVEAATDSNVFTDADHTKLNAIEASADVTDTANVVAALTAGSNITIASDGTIAGAAQYTHPTHAGDDAAIDTGALSGATVISDLDLNITTDTLGHVTDANATVATRNLTLGDLGYTGATNANNYSHPTGNGNNHIPSGGSSGKVLGYASAGTASWITPSEGGVFPISSATYPNSTYSYIDIALPTPYYRHIINLDSPLPHTNWHYMFGRFLDANNSEITQTEYNGYGHFNYSNHETNWNHGYLGAYPASDTSEYIRVSIEIMGARSASFKTSVKVSGTYLSTAYQGASPMTIGYSFSMANAEDNPVLRLRSSSGAIKGHSRFNHNLVGVK